MPKRKSAKKGEGRQSKYFKSKDGHNNGDGNPPEKGLHVSVSASASHNSVPVSNDLSTVSMRCDLKFFEKPCKELARALLGKKLVRILSNGERLCGTIVETEAYIGGEDKGSHSFQGKRTARNEAMYMTPGTVYVYHIYGMYTCINISSQGDGAAVLIRGLAAIEGQSNMRSFRGKKRSDGGKNLKEHELCNGPSKLTQALDISKAQFDQQDLVANASLWVEEGDSILDTNIISCSRIGINYAGDWAKVPLRFYIGGNKGVSVRNKEAETSH